MSNVVGVWAGLVAERRILETEMGNTGTASIVRTPAAMMASAILRAVEVIGSAQDTQVWLNQPLTVLGNKTPLSLLDNAEFKRFEDLLSHIEHGVFA
jgi:uncharacterized protein (DUF2384 family)